MNEDRKRDFAVVVCKPSNISERGEGEKEMAGGDGGGICCVDLLCAYRAPA